MLKEYQVTLFCTTGEYKPVSCIIKQDNELIRTIGKENFVKTLRIKGIEKICVKRYWTKADLKRYNYLKIKVREYNKEKIEKEKAEKYEAIKKKRGWVTS
jgi:hypothetical protein